jgi:hypothetical protein
MKKALGVATVTVVLSVTAIGASSASAAGALPTVTTVVSSLNPSVVGDTVTFTATVTKSLGIPLGSLQFLDAGSPLSGVLTLASGSAQFTTSTLTAGTHDITASYLPAGLDPLSLGSLSSTLTQVVNTSNGGGGGGGGGGGLPGICIPGLTPPAPTISAPARVVGPHAVTVKGTASPNDPVDLYQLDAGSTTFAKVGSVVAGLTGSYSFSRNISKRATFVARDTCGPVSSAKAVTKVALAVTEKVSSPKKGRLRLRAVTAPRVANQLAKFYRVKKGGKRVLLAKVATGAKGVAHKTIKAHSGKRYRVIAIVRAPAGNLKGTSRREAVTVR